MIDAVNDFSIDKAVMSIIWIVCAIFIWKRQAFLKQATVSKDEFTVYHCTWYPWLFMFLMLGMIIYVAVNGFVNGPEQGYPFFVGLEILVCVAMLSVSYWKISVKGKEITYYSLFKRGDKAITFDMIKRAEHAVGIVESGDYPSNRLVFYSSDGKKLLSVPTDSSNYGMLLKRVEEHGVKIVETYRSIEWW